jgi:uncharacterized protein
VATAIEQKLNDELKDAMRSGDDVRRDAVRMLRAALKKEELDIQQRAYDGAKKKGQEPDSSAIRTALTDDDAVRVVNRLAKQHRESIDQFRKANRLDLAAHEESQLAVVERYLPQLMPREQVEVIVRETVAGMDTSTGLKAQGAVMAALSPKLRGKADMKIVSEIVRGLLANATR